MIMSASQNTNKRPSPIQMVQGDPKRAKTKIQMLCSYNGDGRGSSSEESDSEDEDDEGYQSAPLTIGSPVVDHNTSRAICQYSENEDDEDEEEVVFHAKQERSNSSILNTNYNPEALAPPTADLSDETCFINNKRYSINVAELVSNKTPDEKIQQAQHTMSGSLVEDVCARNRCLDYLVNAIDAAWSRYCDGTSYEEDIAYNYDDEAVVHSSGDDDDDNGYKSELSNYTSVTEYDSDMAASAALKTNRSMSIMGNASVNINSENSRLQELKERLTKAKYYLEDCSDSTSVGDCIQFWKKWDVVKYATVELVEDEDDDDVVERKIEDLERGRYWGSLA